jgi:hypothetical protein
MPIVRVLHLFLQPLQSNSSEREPAHFPTHGTLLAAEPSFSHVAQTQAGVIADGKAEFDLGDNFTVNATRDAGSFLSVRAAHMLPWRVNSCASQSAHRLVRMHATC